jgi:acetyl-CoA carboxylase carboxyl transferase subunit beta
MAIARARALAALFDADSTTEIGARLGPTDLLKFKDQKSTASASRSRRRTPASTTR